MSGSAHQLLGRVLQREDAHQNSQLDDTLVRWYRSNQVPSQQVMLQVHHVVARRHYNHKA